MCGRYTGNDEVEEFAEIYERTLARYPGAGLKRGEIFPGDTAPILYGGDMMGVPARFGFPSPRGKGVLFNARGETAEQKVTFRESLLLRRCVVPTTGYCEWNGEKRKFVMNRPGEEMLYLGGFCKRFEDGARFVILTTVPNESVSAIHDRMPVILTPDILRRWNEDTPWALHYLKTVMPQLAVAEMK